MEKLPVEVEPRHAVDAVPHHRELDRRKMHPDLVRATGLEPHVQERVRGEKSLYFEVRDSVPRPRGVERVPRGIVAVAADRRLDPATARTRVAAYESEVLALELAPANEVLKAGESLLTAGNHEQSGCVPVEPMHDASPLLRPAHGASATKGAGERSGDVPRTGVDDDAGWLVDDEHVLVLPRDLEAGRVRLLGRQGLWFGQLDHDLLAGHQPVALGTRQAVHAHSTICDQPLHGGARVDVEALREVPVQPLPRVIGEDAERDQERSVDAP